MVNVYRISRITNWNIGNVNILIGFTNVIAFIAGTILLFFLTTKWMKVRKVKFWTVILWVPYFVLFVYFFASLFPITSGGDSPNPVTGFLPIGAVIVYPIYILIINFTSSISADKTIKTV